MVALKEGGVFQKPPDLTFLFGPQDRAVSFAGGDSDLLGNGFLHLGPEMFKSSLGRALRSEGRV